MLQEIDFSDLSVEQQQVLLKSFQGRELQKIRFLNASGLTDDLLSNFLFGSVVELDLRGCLGLRYFSIYKILGENKPFNMRILQRLFISDSINLTEIKLNAPLLEILNASNCTKLRIIEIKAPELKSINLNGCQSFKLKKLKSIEHIINNCLKLKYFQHFEINELTTEIAKIQGVFSESAEEIDYLEIYKFIRFNFYEKSAEELLNTGWRHANGVGESVDHRKACIYYLLSFYKDGVDIGCNNIGFMYQFCKDFGTEFEPIAVHHYTKGANLNEPYATFALAFMLERGIGTEKIYLEHFIYIEELLNLVTWVQVMYSLLISCWMLKK